MKKIIPLKNKVLAQLIDTFDIHQTKGGIYVYEKEGTSEAIRPRWFKVVAVGPDQTDIKESEYILVPHGRWSRGVDFFGTNRKKDFVFNIDIDSVLSVTTEDPTI